MCLCQEWCCRYFLRHETKNWSHFTLSCCYIAGNPITLFLIWGKPSCFLYETVSCLLTANGGHDTCIVTYETARKIRNPCFCLGKARVRFKGRVFWELRALIRRYIGKRAGHFKLPFGSIQWLCAEWAEQSLVIGDSDWWYFIGDSDWWQCCYWWQWLCDTRVIPVGAYIFGDSDSATSSRWHSSRWHLWAVTHPPAAMSASVCFSYFV